MQMNPGIILAGQQVDAIGNYARGAQAGAQMGDIQQQNALRNLYQSQGPQIMAGDQNALNALAQFSPEAALGIQSQRQNMAAQSQRMDILSAAEKRAVEEHALKLDSVQRAQESQQIEMGLTSAIRAAQAGDWGTVNGILQQVGEQPVQSEQEFRAVAAKYKGVLDILKDIDSMDKPADEYGRYAQEETAAGRQPLNRIDFEQAKKGSETIYGPDGQPILQRGPATMKPFTEAQSKDNVYSTRARGALEAFEPVANALTSRGENMAEMVPFGFGRDFQSGDFQVAKQAGEEFLTAILRKDTGAAITSQEQDIYGNTYLPRPGDGQQVLETKRQARVRAINALESGMSPAQMLARDQALVNAARESGGQVKTKETGDVGVPDAAPSYLTPQDADLWGFMTPTERKAVLSSSEYEGMK